LISAVLFRGPIDAALLRCIAILLITHSHLDALYPAPQIATGGALGNALFFLSSGYGLAEGLRSVPSGFGSWYASRLLRLYPATVITVAVFELGARGGWMHWSVLDYLAMFVWPTPAWFISALLIFYLGLYLTLRAGGIGLHRLVLGATVAVYLAAYWTQVDLDRYSIEGPSNFKWIFYFLLMMLGAYLSRTGSLIGPPRAWHYLAGLALALAYLGVGYALAQGQFTRYQFAIHAITVPLVMAIAILCRAPWLASLFTRFTAMRFAVLLLAGVTLEVYLLQFYVYSHPIIISLPFPQNVAVFSLVLLSLAVILRAAAARIGSALGAPAPARSLMPER
jgi:peptidoglycan/LPS O-acetylase OafA/YrhL